MSDYLPFKDISYAQGLWDMDTDSDPIVAMKASGYYTGSLLPYLDDQLVRNYADAIRLGKVPILYHFAGGSDPVTEANYFVAAVSPLAVGDVYALDWEIEHPDPVGWVLAFVTQVHKATDVWPLVYLDISRLDGLDWSPVLKNCGLWLAAPSYGFDQNAPVQYPYIAQQGPVVNGVDTDAWFDTIEVLKDYGYKKSVPVVEPTPVPAPTPPPTPAPVVPTPVPSGGTAIDVVVKQTPPTQVSSPLSATPEKTPVPNTPVVAVTTPRRSRWQWISTFIVDIVRGI